MKTENAVDDRSVEWRMEICFLLLFIYFTLRGIGIPRSQKFAIQRWHGVEFITFLA